MSGESPAKKARRVSLYTVIEGESLPIDVEILDKGQAFAKGKSVTLAEAKSLWEFAQQGRGLSRLPSLQHEIATIEYCLKTCKFSDDGAKYLKTTLGLGSEPAPSPAKPAASPSPAKPNGGGYYKIIDGVKYDRALLEMAEGFAADGQISFPEAQKLTEAAEDGKGITEIEKGTFLYILKIFTFTDKAKAFFMDFLGVKPADFWSHGSFYKQINGVKYDRELLETAEKFAKDGQISYPEAVQLWEDAQDGRGVTDIEKATLQYTMKELKYSKKASEFMTTMLASGKYKAYYKVIDGVKYDRELLEEAQKSAADGQISDVEMKRLWTSAQDSKQVTAVEKATFKYMRQTMKITPKALEFLNSVLK